MSQGDDFVDSDRSDFSQKLLTKGDLPPLQKYISFSSLLSKEGLVDPPRQLPKRSYSLEPDLATGWKPKKIGGSVLNNVFPLNCSSRAVDFLIRQLYRKRSKQWEVVYLGPRKQNSYMLHQNRKYQNPYPISKKLEPYTSQRSFLPLFPITQQKNLTFNSDFQCGNLDAAIYLTHNQYDLFMRVDTNTKGHTNWYYFTVQNGNFVGTVRFNICNFRREKSLYERGLKPYYYSKKNSDSWKQGGDNLKYEKKPLRYDFLYEDQDYSKTLKTYLTLSFTYIFDTPNDTVQLAYFIPYSYSRLLKFLPTLKNCKNLPSLKTLSGLSIPILEVTDDQSEEYNKKVVIITGRIHPGEANSSFVCEGLLESICGDEPKAKEFRKNFIAYVIPMINPDGVVAGNYRTSLFGKDLNRTFNQSRKFAFPQTFHLLQVMKDLKAKYKQKLNLFIDLHGHSVKKNIFMYGPEFNIHHPNYYLAKQLPKILSSLTPYFRFYSCIFKISSQKSATARATLNKSLNIPFTYTMQSSNGFYYDSEAKKQFELTSKKLKKMGVFLAEALLQFKQIQSNRSQLNGSSLVSSSPKHKSQLQSYKQADSQLDERKNENLNSNGDKCFQEHQMMSDDNISEGNSDSEPDDQDLNDAQLNKLLQTIQEGKQSQIVSGKSLCPLFPSCPQSPLSQQNEAMFKFTKFSQQKIKQKIRYKKRNPLLPPINSLNRAQAKQRVKKSQVQVKAGICRIGSPQKQRSYSKHISISQMIEDARVSAGSIYGTKRQQMSLIHPTFKKKTSKLQLQKAKLFNNNRQRH